MLVDAHCHLDSFSAPEIEEIIARARAVKVERLIANGMWKAPGDFGSTLELAKTHSCVSPTVAIHPHDCGQAIASDWDRLEALAQNPLVVAVGETGLDFHYHHSSPGRQREAFRWTIALAKRVKKPLVVHVREADDEAIRILQEEGASEVGGQIHCFSGNRAFARAYLDLGFYLSFSGIVTFKNADEIREVAKMTPDDRLLIETDSPYLAPLPYRGKRNEPAFLVETAKRVAQVRETGLEELARVVWRNAQQLFKTAGKL